MPDPSPRVEVEDLLERLQKVRPAGDGRWTALCPAHGDKRPSLSVRLGEDGRILLHCHAGCGFPDLCRKLGVEPRQLFPPRDVQWRPTRPRPDPEARARALYQRLRRLRRPPPPERMRRELVAIGSLIAGGTREWPRLTAGASPDLFSVWILGLLYQAMAELVAEGTPRSWFSVLAMARLIDHAAARPGHARALGIFAWARMALQLHRAAETAEQRKGQAHG